MINFIRDSKPVELQIKNVELISLIRRTDYPVCWKLMKIYNKKNTSNISNRMASLRMFSFVTFDGHKSETLVSRKRWELAKMRRMTFLEEDIHNRIVNVVLRDLDLNFQDKQMKC